MSHLKGRKLGGFFFISTVMVIRFNTVPNQICKDSITTGTEQ